MDRKIEEEDSPETKEFLTLEKELLLEEDVDTGSRDSSSDNFKIELENKLEERKRSRRESTADVIDFNDDEGLQMMERRQLRSFSRADEYLYAMKEDLSEWLNLMYEDIEIHAENFMDRLETGEHLVKHANAIRSKYSELMEKIRFGTTKRKVPGFSVPEKELPLRENVPPGSWFARDNVYNFIKFCRRLGVMECVMFETEDLVCRKNEKHVILTLLEVARRGAKLGMLAPILVQFEQEIDREIAREEKEQQRREEKERKEEEKRLREEKRDEFNSLQVNVDGEEISLLRDFDADEEDIDDDDDEEDEETDDEECDEEERDTSYNYPIGPLPQLITNDLKSLDEMVRELVSDCQCPTQFPMIRISEGKYRIGESKVLIFVRILRNHVMVRVGGGWDTLQHYLDKHDPCRCKVGHKATLAAHISTRAGKGPMAVGVCYDRNELIFGFRKTSEPVYRISDIHHLRSDSPGTPGTPRRRSSASNLSNMGRRSSSVTPLDKIRSGSPASLIRQVPRSSSRDLLNKIMTPNGCSNNNKNHYGNRKVSSSSSSGIKVNQQPFLQSGCKTMSDRSDSSCSIPSTSNLGDSGSEVSDEGYKSCQGVPAPSMIRQEVSPIPSTIVPPRPESECSSTISSDTEDDDDDKTDSTATRRSSAHQISSSPIKMIKSRDPSPARSLDGTPEVPFIMNRSRSISSVHSASSSNTLGGGFMRSGGERRSYRAPQTNSRYMKAAEAYANKRKVPARSEYRSNYIRSSSASPSPYVRSSPATTPQPTRRRFNKNPPPTPTASSQSTPVRKPSRNPPLPSLEAFGIEDEDDDVLILKKMEEILLTYKSRVEGRLAAEGRQLPKEIFEDFTSHWVSATAKQSPGVIRIVQPPTPRKEYREQKEKTKIPIPTFYGTQIPPPPEPPHR